MQETLFTLADKEQESANHAAELKVLKDQRQWAFADAEYAKWKMGQKLPTAIAVENIRSFKRVMQLEEKVELLERNLRSTARENIQMRAELGKPSRLDTARRVSDTSGPVHPATGIFRLSDKNSANSRGVERRASPLILKTGAGTVVMSPTTSRHRGEFKAPALRSYLADPFLGGFQQAKG